MVPNSRGQAVGLGIIKVSFLCQAQYIQLPRQHLGLNSCIPSSNGKFFWDTGSQTRDPWVWRVSDYGKVQSLSLQVAFLNPRLGQTFVIRVHEFSKGLYSKKGKVCAPSKATNYSALAKLSHGRILPIYLQPKRAFWLTSSKVPCLINSNNSRCHWVLTPWGSLC